MGLDSRGDARAFGWGCRANALWRLARDGLSWRGMAIGPVRISACVVCALAAAACVRRSPHGAGALPDRVSAASHPVEPLRRLGDAVVPSRYEVQLTLDPRQEGYGGHVAVHLRVNKPTQTFRMHALELTIDAVSLEIDGRRSQARVKALDESGLLQVDAGFTMPPGEALVRIDYRSTYGQRLVGLYKVVADKEPYLFTQFEPTWARRAFPCFDEPAFKTPFDLTIIAPAELEVAANTPVVEKEQLADASGATKGLRRLRFATTRPLPTYLLALAVGPFDVVEGPATGGTQTPLRGLAVRGRGEALHSALETVPDMIAYLEGYFGRAYPYRKLDLVAVPDFASGAMENVGLVTFRESLLLLDAQATAEQRRWVQRVLAHELAHQWFGNLVTPAWWDDLWLNEAFATWMANRVLAEVDPSFDAELYAQVEAAQAMRSEGLSSARRVRQPVLTAHDIGNAFDAITYQKGAAVLRMVENWAGHAKFRAAVRRYLRAHEHSTATTGDFLAALKGELGDHVAQLLSSFIEQPGVPLVEVTPSCKPEGIALSLRQRRFVPLGSSAKPRRRWTLPLCFRRNASAQEACTVLSAVEQTKHLWTDAQSAAPGCPTWVLPNAGAHGYFRFSIPRGWWRGLRREGFATLSDPERLMLADNLRASFAGGHLEAGDTMAWLYRLARDERRELTEHARELFVFVQRHVADQSSTDRLEHLGRRYFRPTFERLELAIGHGADSADNRTHHAEVMSFLALRADDRRLREELLKQGQRFLRDMAAGETNEPSRAASELESTQQSLQLKAQTKAAEAAETMPQTRPKAEPTSGPSESETEPSWDRELLAAALQVLVVDGSEQDFAQLLALATALDEAWLRQTALRALGFANAPERAERVRDLSLSPALRSNERLYPLLSQFEEPATQAQAWSWLQKHYNDLVPLIAPRKAGELPWLGAHRCSEEAARQLHRFFASRIARVPGGPRNLQGAIETTRVCAARVRKHRAATRAWIRSH